MAAAKATAAPPEQTHIQAFEAIYAHAMDPYLTLARVDHDLSALDQACVFFAAQEQEAPTEGEEETYGFDDGVEEAKSMDILSRCRRLRDWVRRQRVVLARLEAQGLSRRARHFEHGTDELRSSRNETDPHVDSHLKDDIRILASTAEWLDKFTKDDRHFALWTAKDRDLPVLAASDDGDGDGDATEEAMESIGAVVRACRKARAAVCVGEEMQRVKTVARNATGSDKARKMCWCSCWSIALSLLALLAVVGTSTITARQWILPGSSVVHQQATAQTPDLIISPYMLDQRNNIDSTHDLSGTETHNLRSWQAYLSTSPEHCAYLPSSPLASLSATLCQFLANPPPLPPSILSSFSNTTPVTNPDHQGSPPRPRPRNETQFVDLHLRTTRHISRVATLLAKPPATPHPDLRHVLAELKILRDLGARVRTWIRLRSVLSAQQEGGFEAEEQYMRGLVDEVHGVVGMWERCVVDGFGTWDI